MKITSIVIDDEPHAAEEIEILLDRSPGVENLATFNDVDSAIEFLNTNGVVDVIFSDIRMPKINGLDAGELLNNYCSFLIYVTAYREHALEAFGANASGYLLKPLSQAALIKQLTEISKRIDKKEVEREEERYILVKGSSKNSFVKIEINDIVYIEALLNYVKIYTKTDFVITYMGLKDVDEMLGKKRGFIRVSRSVIISMRYLERVEGNTLKLLGNVDITVGETFRSEFHTLLKKHSINP